MARITSNNDAGLVFLDTETTGLDANLDQLVELTYATLESEPKTLYFGIETVPDFIDSLIGFTARGLSGRRSTDAEIDEYLTLTKGQTMVAANPAFDKAFLENNGLFHFHYRMVDIESYAMGVLKLEKIPGMATVYDILKEYTDLTEPDHTSYNDVLAMRQAFVYLRDMEY